MVTIITDSATTDIASGRAAGDDLWVDRDDVESAIGWTLKAEGLCQGPVCIPTPRRDPESYLKNGEVNLAAWWKLMERPVLHDAAGDAWVFGAGAMQRADALKSLDAPDFSLPDLDGNMHALSDYRGKRVFLTTWSSW